MFDRPIFELMLIILIFYQLIAMMIVFVCYLMTIIFWIILM